MYCCFDPYMVMYDDYLLPAFLCLSVALFIMFRILESTKVYPLSKQDDWKPVFITQDIFGLTQTSTHSKNIVKKSFNYKLIRNFFFIYILSVFVIAQLNFTEHPIETKSFVNSSFSSQELPLQLHAFTTIPTKHFQYNNSYDLISYIDQYLYYLDSPSGTYMYETPRATQLKLDRKHH